MLGVFPILFDSLLSWLIYDLYFILASFNTMTEEYLVGNIIGSV